MGFIQKKLSTAKSTLFGTDVWCGLGSLPWTHHEFKANPPGL